ncbi:MAG: TlyA family RNA methyltransferase [Mesorhizobium sp.]|uniref:TlyA family RNA methyltransferase n=1 Tax=Mesorhizobium sp. TaxID=1871066 RepID=UPI001221CEFE|nr:TlyA family RNA methyltransferase [Mesorhizobium sp.]TIO54612.1 MAG: TlyA family RNA methyltransferase [Mesorhizobium sp.]TIO62547.1 MAG: TlyA family RNA methyltransferase [Mesorhizobium sp.]TJV66170.1 MAG: TlyA family RNA methyltransferase [Mesorhizobium sp.]
MSSPVPASARLRLDELLVERGLFASRSRARDAIERGTVAVNGAVARKPGQAVAPDCRVAIDDPAQAYVSRAALKLIAGLDRFGLDPSGSEALDIGASTGGFTQVLLERGAAHVTAIDVGHGQIHPDIAGDPRVTVIEGLNARDLTTTDLGGRIPDFLVCDVSFISLKLALPPALALAGKGASALLLVKPQFEAGREAIGKGGLLRDPSAAERIAVDLRDWLAGISGWRVLGLHPSPIEGGDGNREFLLGAVKDAGSK